MTINNIPWRYSHLKSKIGYRRWESLKSLKDKSKQKVLLDFYGSGKRILFVHIPKTAGVSLIRTYEEYFADARHSPALTYKMLLGKRFEEFTTFSVVRNPWARVFSAYNFLKNGGLIPSDRAMGDVLNRQCPTFEEFIKDWLPKNGVCSYMHFVPQYEFVCGWGKNVIVDHILKLERINKDWAALATDIAIPVREIGKSNASSNNHYRDFYDQLSIEIVRNLYSEDIELFGYVYD